jgi:hypothetical protein
LRPDQRRRLAALRVFAYAPSVESYSQRLSFGPSKTLSGSGAARVLTVLIVST